MEENSELPLIHDKRARLPSQFKGGLIAQSQKVKELEGLSGTIQIDEFSKAVFELSNDNVAFVGVYDTSKNKLYLHPLVPWKEHYSTNEFKLSKEIEDKLTHISAQYSTNVPSLTPIKHIQLESPSHKQLCNMYGLDINNCLGFSITKNDGVTHTFNAQSISLNRSKFQQAARETRGDEMGYLPRQYIQFLMAGLKKTMPEQISTCDYGDGSNRFTTFMETRPAKSSTTTENISSNKINL